MDLEFKHQCDGEFSVKAHTSALAAESRVKSGGFLVVVTATTRKSQAFT